MSDGKTSGGSDFEKTGRAMRELLEAVTNTGLAYVKSVTGREFVACARGERPASEAIDACNAAHERAMACVRLALDGRFEDATREAMAMASEVSS